MSYESWEEQKVREAYDKVKVLKYKLGIAEANLAIARLELEAADEGYAGKDDD